MKKIARCFLVKGLIYICTHPPMSINKIINLHVIIIPHELIKLNFQLDTPLTYKRDLEDKPLNKR